MYKIIVDNPASWIPKLCKLLDLNWHETGLNFEFKPDVEVYNKLYEAGFMYAVIALVDDEPVGYCSVMISPHAHNRDIVIAKNDALFVHPDYRNTLLPGRLIKVSEAESKKRGADSFYWHCKTNTGMANMLSNHGYSTAETVMVRGL